MLDHVIAAVKKCHLFERKMLVVIEPFPAGI